MTRQPSAKTIQYAALHEFVPHNTKFASSGPKYGDIIKHDVQIPIFFACSWKKNISCIKARPIVWSAVKKNAWIVRTP